MAQKSNLNTLLGMMIMISLDYYAWNLLKKLGMLNTLIAIRQWLTRLLKKAIKKYTKKRRKINSLMNKEFDSELAYGDNDKYVKTRIK